MGVRVSGDGLVSRYCGGDFSEGTILSEVLKADNYYNQPTPLEAFSTLIDINTTTLSSLILTSTSTLDSSCRLLGLGSYT